MIRIITYTWSCLNCGKEEEFKYEVFEFEEIPVPSNPPLGWARVRRSIAGGDRVSYFCPDCLSAIASICAGDSSRK